MSALGSPSPLFLASAGADAAAFTLEKSVRFNSADSTNLNRTFAAGDRQTFTLSWWMKRCVLNESNRRIFGKSTGSNQFSIMHDSNGRFYTYFNLDSPSDVSTQTFLPQYRDPSAWAHYVLAFDTTQSTDSDRIKFYYNGVQVTTFSGTPNWPTQNASFKWNNASDTYYIGGIGTYYINAYLADMYHVDGQQLDCTSFGAFDDNGVWQAAAYSGTYGTNGFHLFDFANESGIGNDSSGNNNDWTVNNLDSNSVLTSFNLDVTSTPFTDIGKGETITNQGSVDTVAASTNSFNLGTVAEFDGTGQYLSAPSFTLSDNYTFDYYFNSNTSQVSNATVIDIGAEAMIRDYGTATSRNIRLKDTSGSRNDYQYTVTANTWNHVRVSNSGIWVNGTSIQSSPRQIGGTSGLITIGSFNQSTTSYRFNGEIGPVRISDKDLGAPASGGLVANSDGTLSNVTAANTGCDVLRDVPTNGDSSDDTGAGGEVSGNYATLNPLDSKMTAGSISDFVTNGNLTKTDVLNTYGKVRATMPVHFGGKTYFEVNVSGAPTGNDYIGFEPSDKAIVSANGFSSGDLGFRATGYKSPGGASYGSAWSNGDVLGFYFDDETSGGIVGYYLNGVDQGTAWSSFDQSKHYLIAIQDWSNGATAVFDFNFGQRPFAYSNPGTDRPSADFKPLCTTFVATPTIADGSTAFDATLYTGNGSTQSISVANHSPDLVWVKSRNDTTGHRWFDTVRGDYKFLESNSTGAEVTNTNQISITSSGFDTGSSVNTNDNGDTYVSWTWDAGANSSKTYTVKVVSDSGNKYRFDDFGTSAVTLDLEEGSTYVFDQSDSSNSGHPLRFSTTSDGTHNSGSEYTTGVTTTGTPGSAGAKTTIVVAASAPTLYYYCTNHSGMGGQANTNSTAGASNFDGSIQSTVRANQSAGFSIVSWSGSGANATIGHGLNAKPHAIFVKRLDTTSNWACYFEPLGATQYLRLNSNISAQTTSAYWNNTEPTSTAFTVATNDSVNASGGDYVAQLWAPVKSYSSFGTYTGNGSSDGPFVYTGFRPRWILLKSSSVGGSGYNWRVYDSARDPHNVAPKDLFPNLSDAEGTGGTDIDILSNGFKLRDSFAGRNANGATFVYAAFAENPFQANGGLAR